MNYSTRFWDRIAAGYARKPVADETAYQQKLAFTQQYLNSDMDLLEFGCGTGSTALIHAPKVRNYQAIDVSTAMLEIARGKQLDKHPNLKFSCSALEEFQAEPESFDAILGMSILHLLNDPVKGIEKVYQLLKPGGVFISSTACIADSMPWFRYIGPLGSALRLMPPVRVFSSDTLKGYLKQAGFSIEMEWRSENNRISCFLIASKAA